jgi:cytochrome c551/c552
MKTFAYVITGAVTLGVSLAVLAGAAQSRETPPSQNVLIRQYCVGCHNETSRTGGLSLATFDMSRADQSPETTEKMIRKLRTGMMPPAGTRRPDVEAIKTLAASLEQRIDQVALLNPNPGRRTFQRLNRAEYARSIRDLLDLDVDVDALLPPDTVSHNFDNIADVQSLSPTLMESYLRAARQVSLDAVGDATAGPRDVTYKVARTASQMVYVEGTPLGTRGGISIVHNFPADGEYRFKMSLHGTQGGVVWGSTGKDEQVDVSVDGERVALVDVDPTMTEADPNGLTLQTLPVRIKAGPRRVAAAFIRHADGPVDDLMAPIQHTLADQQIGDAYGITVLPHLRDVTISGPTHVIGVSETPSRRKIFTCNPTPASDEIACARKIVAQLATRAYRRPVTSAVLEPLMKFFVAGRRDRDFASGIQTAIQAILASPRFVFRLEQEPAGVTPGANYRIDDLALASRLAYFLWATAPDPELLRVAGQGRLQNGDILEQQVHRMLRDSRAESLSTRFAAQWLRLQDLAKLHPDALLFPLFDARLGEAMRRETELFFDWIVREDRSVLELLTANYTFVNERLAMHYRIPNVSGGHFRRVEIPDENRRGLLGQGSILTLTSVADRTSPVQRGKWILEVLFGSPPPPPPPNVPTLDETKGVVGTTTLSVRERMEEHRKNPACNSCHRVIDPLGLALENFDVTGVWRIRDNGVAVEASGTLYDGTALNGPGDVRQILLKYSDVFVQTLTENLMTYALGRRLDYRDMPAVRIITRQSALEGNRFSSLIIGVVKSTAFQMSRAEAAQSEH